MFCIHCEGKASIAEVRGRPLRLHWIVRENCADTRCALSYVHAGLDWIGLDWIGLDGLDSM
jgi:hypothetical protein